MLTRAGAEELLYNRCKGWMENAGLVEPGEFISPHPAFNEPLFYSLTNLGVSVTDPLTIGDSDVAGVATSEYIKFLDLAEFRLIQNIGGSQTQTDEKIGQVGVWGGQLPRRVEDRILFLQKKLQMEYGLGASKLQPGILKVRVNSYASSDEA